MAKPRIINTPPTKVEQLITILGMSLNLISLKITTSTIKTYKTKRAALSTKVAKPVKRLRIINRGIAISHLAIFPVFRASSKTNLCLLLVLGLLYRP